MCRAMEFVQQFIAEVAGGEQSLDVAAGKAYGVSLRRYHGWMVRGVFYVSLKFRLALRHCVTTVSPSIVPVYTTHNYTASVWADQPA